MKLTQDEALATLRLVASMTEASVVRLYDNNRRPAERRLVGLAAVRWSDIREGGYLVVSAWHDRDAWVYGVADGLLLWRTPNALADHGAWVSWRGIDYPAGK